MRKPRRAKATPATSGSRGAVWALLVALGCSGRVTSTPLRDHQAAGEPSYEAGGAGRTSSDGGAPTASGASAGAPGGHAGTGDEPVDGRAGTPGACDDALHNGDEEEVDCGGSCAACPVRPCLDLRLWPPLDHVLAEEALVGWYRFQDARRPGADSSAAGHDALQHQGVAGGVDDEERGCVARFEGAGALELPAVTTKSLTFSLWLRTSQAGAGRSDDAWFAGSKLLDAARPGVVEDFGLSLLGDSAAFGVGKPDTTLRARRPLNDDAWHQVVATRDDSSGEVALYIDGHEAGRSAAPPGERSAVTTLNIGGNQLVARLADVRLYDRVLSMAEIAQLYQGD